MGLGGGEQYDDRLRNTSLTVGVIRRKKTTKQRIDCSLAKLAFIDNKV